MSLALPSSCWVPEAKRCTCPRLFITSWCALSTGGFHKGLRKKQGREGSIKGVLDTAVVAWLPAFCPRSAGNLPPGSFWEITSPTRGHSWLSLPPWILQLESCAGWGWGGGRGTGWGGDKDWGTDGC